MSDTNKWADSDHKWNIIEERKHMWHQSQIDRIAAVIGLSPGMSVADIGCGLGYLGWTYWKYYGQGGSYTGVDCSSELYLKQLRTHNHGPRVEPFLSLLVIVTVFHWRTTR